jgi:asparagine synthase (glutamine-hydrolysing)
MCGIVGFIDPRTTDLERVCLRMTDAIHHRGPDDAGTWTQHGVGLALGQRRLSIVDLSPAGHQPMHSANGRYHMTFNGEIYNHARLRADIEARGHASPWRGRSDTETLIEGFSVWGIRGTLERAVGMFALAVWDREQRRLTLARDRAGEKPLYYGTFGRAFLFGSELKALQAHPAFRAEVDRGSLALFLRYGYVPDARSIFTGVKKLPPAAILEVDEAGNPGEPSPFWRVEDGIAAGRARPFAGTDAQALDELERLLETAIAGQMMADVPLGAFLSGGIDSSIVVALMQKQTTRRVQTFTIGFTQAQYNEAPHASAVARHLGTEHTELIVTPAEAQEVIPRLPQIYDEPFADSSQIPTFLVSALARRHVTVSLSGDAGDELFGGYNRYAWAKRLWRTLGAIPSPIRSFAAQCIRSRSPEAWSRTMHRAGPFMPERWRAARMGDKLHKLADLIGSSRTELYHGLVSHWPKPGSLVSGVIEPLTRLTEVMAGPKQRSFEEDMMYWDLISYLPGDILVKVDRAAMAVSLETRVPLHLRVRNGEGKWLLKQLLARYVPRKLTDRPKTGFGIPIDSWLRGPLRDWAEELLDPVRIRREGYLDPAPIREKWHEHLSGSRNWAYWLWDVLMFQAWWAAQAAQAAAHPSRGTARSVIGVEIG